MSERKMVRRSVSVVLGIICIILTAFLGGTMAYYTLAISDRDNTIAGKNNQIDSLNSQISQLRSNVTSLWAWLDGNESLLRQTETWLDGNITAYNSLQSTYNIYVNDHSHANEEYQNLQNQIASLQSQITNLQNQLNSLGTGTLSIIFSNPSVWVNKTVVVQGALAIPAFLPWEIPLWNYLLVSSNYTSFIGVLWNGAVPNSSQVQIYGVVRQGQEELWDNGTETVFYIEAETISPI
jgi:prefoldin subunit 5